MTTDRPRAYCPVCRQRVRVRKDGRVRRHYRDGASPGGDPVLSRIVNPCPGSGEEPKH